MAMERGVLDLKENYVNYNFLIPKHIDANIKEISKDTGIVKKWLIIDLIDLGIQYHYLFELQNPHSKVSYLKAKKYLHNLEAQYQIMLKISKQIKKELEGDETNEQ